MVNKKEERVKMDVREKRKELNLTQEEFAHKVGVTVSTVNRWENHHNAPSRIARRLINSIIGDDSVS